MLQMWKLTKASFPANIFFFCRYFMCITSIFPSTAKNVYNFHCSIIEIWRMVVHSLLLWKYIWIHTHPCCHPQLYQIVSMASIHKAWLPWLEETLKQKGKFIMYNTLFFDCVASSFPFSAYVYSIKSSLTSFLETKIDYWSFNSLKSKK